MSEPFLAEVRIVGFNFAPRGWAFCDGQILPINQNQSLYSLLGTTYGGDGQTSFALPDLRGRTPIHPNTISLGQKGGSETETLTAAQLASHTHTVKASVAVATDRTGSNDLLSVADSRTPYGTNINLVDMKSGSIASTGGGQAHNNLQPYLVLNYVIALQGLFPSRN